jgi:hypothetical protein
MEDLDFVVLPFKQTAQRLLNAGVVLNHHNPAHSQLLSGRLQSRMDFGVAQMKVGGQPRIGHCQIVKQYSRISLASRGSGWRADLILLRMPVHLRLPSAPPKTAEFAINFHQFRRIAVRRGVGRHGDAQ